MAGEARPAQAGGPANLRPLRRRRNHTARVWDVRTAQQIAALRGHNHEVHSASFSPDGKFVVTTASDEARLEYGRFVLPRGHVDRHGVVGRHRATVGRADRSNDRCAAPGRIHVFEVSRETAGWFTSRNWGPGTDNLVGKPLARGSSREVDRLSTSNARAASSASDGLLSPEVAPLARRRPPRACGRTDTSRTRDARMREGEAWGCVTSWSFMSPYRRAGERGKLDVNAISDYNDDMHGSTKREQHHDPQS